MDTLKTAIVVVLLLAVLYIVYVVLNKSDAPLPEEVAWHQNQAMEPLQVDIGGGATGGAFAAPTMNAPAMPPASSFASASPSTDPAQASGPMAAHSMTQDSQGGSGSRDQTRATGPSPPPIQPPPGVPSDFAEPHFSRNAPDLISPDMETEPGEHQASRSEGAAASSSYAATAAAAAMAPNARAAGEMAESAIGGDVDNASSFPDDGDFADQPPSDSSSADAAVDDIAGQPDPGGGPAAASQQPRLIDSAIQSARGHIDRGQYYEALLTLSYAYNDPEVTSAERAELHELVDPLAGKVIYSREHLMEAAYEVQAGDTLPSIAEQYEVPWQLLANINGITDLRTLEPGRQLKVVRGPFHAEIDLQAGELTLFVRRLYAGRFPIQVGDNVPPAADYTVQDKQPGQTFYAGDARTLAADDPRNPFGGIWIDLGGNVCIHARPSSSDAAAFSCISLSQRDANDVYGILSRGSSVMIRR